MVGRGSRAHDSHPRTRPRKGHARGSLGCGKNRRRRGPARPAQPRPWAGPCLPFGGYGRHLFGKPAKLGCAAQAHAAWIAPLKGYCPRIDELVDRIQEVANQLLASCPRTTQIWDVGDRNVMIGRQGRVVGLVDQADIYSGDPMFVPGFSMAMLGDLHGWGQIQAYEQGWKKSWKITVEESMRIELHRVASHGRLSGKHWRWHGNPPPSFNGWERSALALLERA